MNRPLCLPHTRSLVPLCKKNVKHKRRGRSQVGCNYGSNGHWQISISSGVSLLASKSIWQKSTNSQCRLNASVQGLDAHLVATIRTHHHKSARTATLCILPLTPAVLKDRMHCAGVGYFDEQNHRERDEGYSPSPYELFGSSYEQLPPNNYFTTGVRRI